MAEKFTPEAFAEWVRRWSKVPAITVDAAKPEPKTLSERDIPTMVLPAPLPPAAALFPAPQPAGQEAQSTELPRQWPKANVIKGREEWKVIASPTGWKQPEQKKK
jgi:hypothetical protein